MPRAVRIMSTRLMLLATLLAAGTALDDSSANATTPYDPPLRLEVFQAWIQNGRPSWPPNDGFAVAPQVVILQPGTLIDQFVFPIDAANFFYAAGKPYSKRALPYVCDSMWYRVYRVLVPLTVAAGRVAPWFGSPGAGEQFRTDDFVDKLLQDSKVALVSESGPGSKSPSQPCD